LERALFPKNCLLCKEKDKRVFAVHHVDGNHKNNKVSNLTWLCHNCHHLVHCDSVEWKRLADKLANR
jgi:predicted HNH restriction endonuclease